MNAKSTVTLSGLALLGSIASGYEAFHGPTEVIYSDPEKVSPGYLLFAAWAQNEAHEFIYLVDVDGNVVNRWYAIPPKYRGEGYYIEKRAQLTETGSVIFGLSTAGPAYAGERALLELDWDGNLVWDFSDPREGYRYHHDFARIWNNHLND